MAAKETSPNLEFAVAQLKKNPKIPFADLKAAAEKRGLKMMPIIYGRAKLALGLAKPGGARGRVNGRAPRAGARASGAVSAAARVAGLDGTLSSLMDAVRRAEAQQHALDQIRAILAGLETNGVVKRRPGRPRKNP